MTELPKQYDPSSIEPAVSARWLDENAFAAIPDTREARFVVMMPLPNVTGALHMGHAMDNVMQDMLTRWHRMRGDNTLWQAGTDHAGIATQQVVETRLFELEGKTRHDVGRQDLVRRIWEWKDQYQKRIVTQQQRMGCSCDWDRQRFTMDAVCARAVRRTFFRMFAEGLIYQGDRLVNWDCALQTAVADDELYKAPVKGHFWHLRYPVIDPKPGEPDHVTVATTRPETMLGDTAVACHPAPKQALDAAIAKAKEKARSAPQRDRADAQREVEILEERAKTHLAHLETIAAMARDGREVMLPLQQRPIPLILDEWAKPELGSGCVKITPAHDPNDYDVWTRHKDEIGLVNVLAPDGKINANGGAYQGIDRFEARERIVADLEAAGLLESIEDREVEVDHSDRSKTIVEPYVSKQWFVRMGDVPEGIVCGRGTPNEFRSPGLAQAAIDAADPDWKSPTGRSVRFWPDQDRYHKIYHQWLAEKRDWCISRQLWWGHRIPVWKGSFTRVQLLNLEGMLAQDHEGMAAWIVLQDGAQVAPRDAIALAKRDDPRTETMQALLCVRDEDRERNIDPILRAGGLAPEEDVLDTWFSSALWPHSTLGWPDPETARVEEGQTLLGATADGRPDSLSDHYPGSCLVTGRDIITLWVARMVLTGLYNLGDVPFTEVFLHATIMDGRGERMSKSKGNGVDPLDVIDEYGADAMRYVLCEMQTGTQDIRLPVQVISPFDGSRIDLATATPGPYKGTYVDPGTGKVFDMVGMMVSEGLPPARATSDRFEVGRNFCNKLWNAARFAFLNLEGTEFNTLDPTTLAIEDRWILSRLTDTIARVRAGLDVYNASAAVTAVRDFFWNELCDWYLELVKPRMKDAAKAPVARQVLALCLDQVLRLLHPFVPFLTEELWAKLGELAPRRGLDEPLPSTDGLLVTAAWPEPRAELRDAAVESRITFVQEVVSALREVRARYQVAPSARVPTVLKAAGDAAARLSECEHLVAHMAGASSVSMDPAYQKPKDAATAVVRDVEAYVLGVVDLDKEREKLQKQREKLSGQVGGIEKKLGNEGFVAKAPADVVERERARLEDLRRQLASLDAALAEL